jgi:hypothetical protein
MHAAIPAQMQPKLCWIGVRYPSKCWQLKQNKGYFYDYDTVKATWLQFESNNETAES